MTICDPPAAGGRSAHIDDWARRFLQQGYGEWGRLADDFRGFVASHPVPPEQREAVGERVQELLLERALGYGDD